MRAKGRMTNGMGDRPPMKQLHIDTPRPRFEPIVASDHDGSSPEERDPVATAMAEEDVQSVVGPSISRAQTRMISPQTPAAEKTAAMGALGGSNLFDGVAEDKDEEQCPAFPDNVDSIDTLSGQNAASKSTTQTSCASPIVEKTDLPEQMELQGIDRKNASTGPTSMLADLNVKRYVSSLAFPKVPLFDKVSVPSLASVFESTRNRSPLRRESRNKRASTIGTGCRPPAESQENGALVQGQRSDENYQTRSGNHGRAKSQSLATGGSDHATTATTEANPQLPRPQYVRRATSDQSLYLRRVVSAVPSLGDDSRWDNVQEQVNSRMKAIKDSLQDSLQDSSIKLPHLPSMSSFNLNPFRADSSRPRAQSEVEKPTQPSNGISDMVDSHRSKDQEPSSHETNGYQKSRKDPRVTFPHLDAALDRFNGDLVVLGGYRGSILRSAKPPNRQLWVPVKVGLNIRKVNLEVGLEPEDEETMEQTIYPSGMLSHIGPVDMGRRLLKKLANCPSAEQGRLRLHEYGYDWRLSPALLSRKLIAFLEKLPSNQKDVPKHERGALVIAHSMGGLITRHAVNQRPDLFSGVLYAGVPQHCVNILGPFRNGDEVLLSSKVLTAQVNFSMRSSFVLLPDNGLCFINKETKEEYPVDFFNAETWKEYAISPCICPFDPPFHVERKGLLGSISGSLPSLPALPLSSRKPSSASVQPPLEPKRNSSPGMATKVTSADSLQAAPNISNLHPSSIPALDSSLSNPSTSSQLSSSITTSTSTTCTIPPDRAFTYLQRTLRETLAFRHALAYNEDHQEGNLYPPHAIIYANNTPTVTRARVASRAAIRCADAYDDLAFGSGDGVVLARAAQLPHGYRCARGGKFRTEKGHVGLLGDLEGVGQCLAALMRDRARGVGLGVAQE